MALNFNLVKYNFMYHNSTPHPPHQARLDIQISLISSIGALAFWIWFLSEELSELEALVRSLAAQVDGVGSGNNVVDSETQTEVSKKLQEALAGANTKDKRVEFLIKQLLRSEFGVIVTDDLTVHVGDKQSEDHQKESAGYKEVKVDLNQGRENNKGTATLKIAKASDLSGVAEGPIASVIVEKAKSVTDAFGIAHDISRKLAKALSHFKVKAAAKQQGYVTAGGSDAFHALAEAVKDGLEQGTNGSEKIAGALAKQLRIAGSAEFSKLMAELNSRLRAQKVPELVTKAESEAKQESSAKGSIGQAQASAKQIPGKLETALCEQEVKNKIVALIKEEFKVEVEPSHIKVTKEDSNTKVTVTINKQGTSGEKTVEATLTPNVKPNPAVVEFRVQVDNDSNKNQKIAERLKSAFENAIKDDTKNLLEELMKTDFELPSAAVEVEANTGQEGNKVTVNITNGGGLGQGAATLLVLKDGKQGELRIEVSGGGDKAQDIALRLADALADPRVASKVGAEIKLQGGGLRNAVSNPVTLILARTSN